MSEITIFGLALLAVPVFARFAGVPGETRKMYHLIGLSGLMFLLAETVRIAAGAVDALHLAAPWVAAITALLALAGVLIASVRLAIYYLAHPREVV